MSPSAKTTTTKLLLLHYGNYSTYFTADSAADRMMGLSKPFGRLEAGPFVVVLPERLFQSSSTVSLHANDTFVKLYIANIRSMTYLQIAMLKHSGHVQLWRQRLSDYAYK